MMKYEKLKALMCPTVVTMKPHEKVQDALQRMAEKRVSSLVIVDDAYKPMGIFTEHDALACVDTANAALPLESLMSRGVFSVNIDTDVHDAYTLMSSKGYRHVVVVDGDGTLAGMVTQGDFLRHIGLASFVRQERVEALMSTNFLAIDTTQTLSEVALLMHARRFDYAVAVLDAHPRGIVYERDIAQWLAKGGNPHEEIAALAHAEVPTICQSAPLQDAAQQMEAHGMHVLVVLDTAQRIAGVVEREAVLRTIHGGYFEYLIKLVDEKSKALSIVSATKKQLQKDKEIIQKNELKFKTLFELLPLGVVMADAATGQLIEFNELMHRQLGYTAQEFSALKILDFEALENRTTHQAHLNKIKNEGEDFFETKFRTKTGALLDIEVHVARLRLGESDYFLGVCRDITAEKAFQEAEAARQKAYEAQVTFLQTLLNTIPDLIWIKDAQGVYLSCNKTFERFFGASESQIKGKTDFDFVDGALAQFFRDHDMKAMQSKVPSTNEEYLAFADGSYAGIFETVKTAMYDHDGAVIGVIGVARDISERKAKEKSLYEMDEALKTAQAIAHVGSWKIDVASNVLSWSDECYRIFGVALGSPVTYEMFLSFIHPEDQEKVNFAWNEALQGAPYEIEHRIIVNGRVEWVRENAKLHINEAGELVRGIGTVQLISERKQYEQTLEHMANHDALTGLANRSMLVGYLQKTVDKAVRTDAITALLLLDLDRFKDVNDSFGHQAGDLLLLNVSKRLKERMREGDLIARLGGDEFAVVLDDLAHVEDAGRIAHEILKSLSMEHQLEGGIGIHVGASIGIVTAPYHSGDAQELLQFADAALYRAKNEGRGIYRFYTDDLTDAARQRVAYESDLRRAVAQGEFELYYQPQVHFQTGRVVGAEALIRWHHPERGTVSPAEFIPVAEETGLIGRIGAWVLEEACRQGKIWLDAGHRITIAVNVSAHQMRHQDIVQVVDDALVKSGFDPNRLELELTESALMERQEEVVTLLHTLRARGIRLSIDDFGTGYSSLSYLKRFPIDALKIDKSFVDDIPFDNDDMAIVTAIIEMGKALGFQVIAEGTETQEQLDFLKTRGCTLYQGFIKSKPQPASAFSFD